MKNSFRLTAVAGLLTLLSARAGAVPLLDIVASADPMWSGTYSLPLGGSHDVAVTQGKTGWYAANLRALADVSLSFTYLGKEAGWTNTVITGGSMVFNTATSTPDQTASAGMAAAGSWVDFAIKVLVGGNSPLMAVNGLNVAPTGVLGKPGTGYGAPNFWLGYVDGSRSSVYVAFDDGGGYWAGRIDDDNHDDLVFRIDAAAMPVPEPASLALLGTGLLIIGLRRGRRA